MVRNRTPRARSASRPRSATTRADFIHLDGSAQLQLGDHRRWPGCRLVLYCADCSWARDYNPTVIAERLRAVRTGGDQARVETVARRVNWPCPACRHMKWATTLAYPKDTDVREIERLRRQIRS